MKVGVLIRCVEEPAQRKVGRNCVKDEMSYDAYEAGVMVGRGGKPRLESSRRTRHVLARVSLLLRKYMAGARRQCILTGCHQAWWLA